MYARKEFDATEANERQNMRLIAKSALAVNYCKSRSR